MKTSIRWTQVRLSLAIIVFHSVSSLFHSVLYVLWNLLTPCSALSLDRGTSESPPGFRERCLWRCSCEAKDCFSTTGSAGCVATGENHWWVICLVLNSLLWCGGLLCTFLHYFFSDKEAADRLSKTVDEACLLLAEYNGRLAAELEDRRQLARMLSEYIHSQKEALTEREKKLEACISHEFGQGSCYTCVTLTLWDWCLHCVSEVRTHSSSSDFWSSHTHHMKPCNLIFSTVLVTGFCDEQLMRKLTKISQIQFYLHFYNTILWLFTARSTQEQ